MEQVVQVVEQIRTIPGAHVDCNFGQGHEALRTQLPLQFEIPSTIPDPEYVTKIGQRALTKVDALVAPYTLPRDYRFFLEFYGGLNIDRIDTMDYYLSVHGIGPMVEEWYSSLVGDDAYYANGLILEAV